MELVIRQDLQSLRRCASRFFVPLLWLHVPVIVGIALSNGVEAWRPAMFMAVAAAAATLAVWRFQGGFPARLSVAGALTAAPMLMVFAGSGPWQPDWHMYFFVVFGMLVAYVDWRPIAFSTLLTAVHHAILTWLFPSAVFPEADPQRVILHAAIVGVDAIVLFFIVHRMRDLFANIEQTNDDLEIRIAERTGEVQKLNRQLAANVSELERAFTELEKDAAEREAAAARLDHLANHDLVSGLPNRALLMDRLRVALATADRNGTDVLVVCLDLTNFRNVNDTLGHCAGDGVLGSIGARLRGCMRSGDTASRVGGDEFVIVCETDTAVAESERISTRLMAAITQPITVGSSTVSLGASIGISMFSADGPEPDELIRKADLAMYRAKESGAVFHVYSAALHAEMLARSTLKRDLEAAILRDEFVVFYQPIVSLTSRAIVGAEALVRWQHPTRGLLAPDAFIGFAEEHGLIAQIGETVMRKACAQVARFALAPDDEFTMAVNVSAVQFRRPRFVDSIVSVLKESGMERSRLEIEITESVIMDDLKVVMRTLHELSALGLQLSIDDFGTGYSSLAYIKTFPVHTLKIDRSFVKDIGANPTDQAIAATIITLAHKLGMRVIAEGVESEAQLEQLRELGADDMQGYLISRPLPARDFERFVCSYGALKIAA